MQKVEASPDFKEIQSRIVAKEFDGALADLDAILSNDAGNTEALYMKAVASAICGNSAQRTRHFRH